MWNDKTRRLSACHSLFKFGANSKGKRFKVKARLVEETLVYLLALYLEDNPYKHT